MDRVKDWQKCNEDQGRAYGDKYHFGGGGEEEAAVIGGHRKAQRDESGEEEYPEEPVKGAQKLSVWGINITPVSCVESIRSRRL